MLPIAITAELPGTGGTIKVAPEDFVVEEIPAYEPVGSGDHVFITIEKRDLTTRDAVHRLAASLGVRDNDVGVAGQKDRHALTRQRLSLPPPVTPEAALALQSPDLRVLAAARHPHKLRTGHLRGNRFVIRVRGLSVPVEEAASRASAILAQLAAPPGTPNWYGEQRFGRFGDNATRGRALVLGERPTPPPRDGRERRLLVSAFQAELFNRVLAARIRDGLYRRVLSGDLLRKVATGGLFETADPGVDQPRLDAGEIAPTGPMFGHEMRAPSPGTDAAARETAVLAAEGLEPAAFGRVRSLAEGTRRPLGVTLAGVAVRPAAEGVLEVAFELPAGAYATTVLAEITKAEVALAVTAE